MTSKFVAATMLLIIAGAAASMLGYFSIEQSRMQSSHSSIHVSFAQLRELNGIQKAFIVFTVVNTGTVSLVSANASFHDDVGYLVNVSNGHIDPGELWEERRFIDAAVSKDGRYILYVTAESADGSEISTQATVNAI